jgi:hypothetical protein
MSKSVSRVPGSKVFMDGHVKAWKVWKSKVSFKEAAARVSLAAFQRDLADPKIYRIEINPSYEECRVWFDMWRMRDPSSAITVVRYSEIIGENLSIELSSGQELRYDQHFESLPKEVKKIRNIFMKRESVERIDAMCERAWEIDRCRVREKIKKYYSAQEPSMDVLMETIKTEWKRAKFWIDQERMNMNIAAALTNRERAIHLQSSGGFIKALMRALGRVWEDGHGAGSAVPIFDLARDMTSERFSKFDQQLIAKSIEWLKTVRYDNVPIDDLHSTMSFLQPVISMFEEAGY